MREENNLIFEGYITSLTNEPVITEAITAVLEQPELLAEQLSEVKQENMDTFNSLILLAIS